MHSHAGSRHQNMGSGKPRFFSQCNRRPFVKHIARRQLVTAHRGIGKQGASSPVDINPAIGPRGARVRRDGIQRFLVFHQILGQCFKALGAFLKVQCQQIFSTLGAGIVQCTFKINGFGMGAGNGTAIDSAAKGLCGLRTKPLTRDVTLERGGHRVPFNTVRGDAN